jgi:hypothetical protein
LILKYSVAFKFYLSNGTLQILQSISLINMHFQSKLQLGETSVDNNNNNNKASFSPKQVRVGYS